MSKLKVVSIQHPDAVNPSIELAADGSISIDKVPSADINVTPIGGITAENVQAALEELDTNKATTQYVDNNSFDPTTLLALKAEQNVYLWEMQASTLGSTKKFTGWQGEGFLTGQDEVATLTGLSISRDFDVNAGAVESLPVGGSLNDFTEKTTPVVSLSLMGIAHNDELFVVAGQDGTILTSNYDGETWVSQTTPGTDFLRDIIYDNGIFVAVGDGGVIWTSPDGATWTSQSTPGADVMRGVTYGNGIFVAVGNGGVVWTSPDGTTWTSQITPVTSSLQSAVYGNSIFVVAGDDGVILTSSDGITWTSQSTPVTEALRGAAYGNGLFVAVGGTGTILTSPDGVTWTTQTSTADDFLLQCAFSKGFFIVVGRGIILTSPNGEAWTSQTHNAGLSFVRDAMHANGYFVAVGDNGRIWNSRMEYFDSISFVLDYAGTDDLAGMAANESTFVTVGSGGHVSTSPDGLTWTQQTTPSTGYMEDVTYAQGIFVAVGLGATVWTSPDGVTWTVQNGPTSGSDFRAVTYGDGLFVAVSNQGNIWTSPDGFTWSQTATLSVTFFKAVAYGDGLFVAGGFNGEIFTSPDGTTWTPQTTPSSAPRVYSITYGNGLFVAGCILDGNPIWTSPDGETWTQVHLSSFAVLAVTFGNGLFVAVGHDIAFSQDGATWSLHPREPSPQYPNLSCVAEKDGVFTSGGPDGRIMLTNIPGGIDGPSYVVLKSITLPSVSDTVYLLAQSDTEGKVELTYQATLDGGETWEVVSEGELNTLMHSGTQFSLKATMSRESQTSEPGSLFWFIGYAS